MTNALLPVFQPAPMVFDKGEGAWLTTAEGERYLDFGAGIAVNSLGYSHPHLVAALETQARKLWHLSNVYRIPDGERLAERLTAACFADVAFFANSGAEANECAIKIARRYQNVSGRPERWRIITFNGAFHGRTLATMAAGGNPKYLDGFGPAVGGFDACPLEDINAVRARITLQTAAIMIEPIQGESGVRPVSHDFLRQLRALCDEFGLLLIYDEIQCGVGRTGYLFAHQETGVAPDIMSLAKGLGGGFPVGACLATRAAALGMVAGSHGSTFGGNPLAMAVGNAVLDVVLAPGFLEDVQRKSLLFKQKLAGLVDQHPKVFEQVRGAGLLTGLKCVLPNGDVTAELRKENLLVVPAGDNVIRLIPPLNVTDAEIDVAVELLDKAARNLEATLVRGAAE